MTADHKKYQRYSRSLAFLHLMGLVLVTVYALYAPANKLLLGGYVLVGLLFVLVFQAVLPERFRGPRTLAILSYVDIVAIALLVALTGGHNSPFFLFYFMVIVGSASMLGKRHVQAQTALISVLLIPLAFANFMPGPGTQGKILANLAYPGTVWFSLWLVSYWSSRLSSIVSRVVRSEKEIAARNAALYRREREARRELLVIQETSSGFLANLDLDHVLRATTNGLVEGVGYDRAAIFLVDQDLTGMENRCESAVNQTKRTSLTSPLDRPGLLFEAIRDPDVSLKDQAVGVVPIVSRNIAPAPSFECGAGACGTSNCRLKEALAAMQVRTPNPGADFGPPVSIRPLECPRYAVFGAIVVDNCVSGKTISRENLSALRVFAQNVSLAIGNATIFGKLKRKVTELDTVSRGIAALTLSTAPDLKKIFSVCIDGLLLGVEADHASIHLIDAKTQEPRIETAHGAVADSFRAADAWVLDDLFHPVLQTGRSVNVGVGKDSELPDALRAAQVSAIVCLPLMAGAKTLGTLNVYRGSKKEAFTNDDVRLARSFAGQIAAGVSHSQLHDELKENVVGTIAALAAAVEAKDPYTFGHSWSVSGFSSSIAKRLVLDDCEIELVRTAGTLHDIGKLGVDGSILNKPGPLTMQEQSLMRLHPSLGVEILESLAFLKNALPLIQGHHERWDGQGYPDGKAGHEIPLGARIIAVADAFNAMVSDRPYRPRMTPEEALAEIERCAGTQFDPAVVEAFLLVASRATCKVT
ncbi:MAG: HD-GYP domain-containing protein [Terriglobia bacterium]